VLRSGRMSTSLPARSVRIARRPGPVDLIVEGIRDIWSRRRLARYLVRADMQRHGADTLLGNVWWVVDPLLQMAVYVILVSVIFQIGGDDYPLFVFCAILPWKWFSTAINDGITSVTSRERIIKQVSFPKLVLPVAATVGGVVNFAFGMIPLTALIVLFYSDRLSSTILLIPLVAIVQFVFTLALSIAAAAINVFFRDVGNVARHALRMWFYLSPGLYAFDSVAGRIDGILLDLYRLNPWVTLFEAYRNVIYDGRTPDFEALGFVLVASAVLLVLAIYLFKRVEPSFAKVL